MGNFQSNAKNNINADTSPDASTLNWNNYVDNYSDNYTDNLEIIDIDIPEISDSETNYLRTNNSQVVEENGSSPFISTEVYDKIMQGGDFENDESSSTTSDEHLEDESSDTDSSDYDRSGDISKKKKKKKKKKDKLIVFHTPTESLSVTSPMRVNPYVSQDMYGYSSTSSINISDRKYKSNTKNRKSKSNNMYGYSSSSPINEPNKNNMYGFSSNSPINEPNKNNMYGFSSTSSEFMKTSNKRNNSPYKLSSSELNTSDVKLISVNSRTGRRYV